jgi:hypothetical protein
MKKLLLIAVVLCAAAGILSMPNEKNPRFNGLDLNSYWQMPFRKSCKIAFENLSPEKMTLYYQIDYTLTDVPDDVAYFHTQFRRSNPVPDKYDHVITKMVLN